MNKTQIVAELHEKLEDAIMTSGMSLVEICKKAKISRHMLWQYRFYAVTPSPLVLARLAITLNISVDYLLGLSKKKELTA